MKAGKAIPVENKEQSLDVQKTLIRAGYQPIGGGVDLVKGDCSAICIEKDRGRGPEYSGLVQGSAVEVYELISVEEAILLVSTWPEAVPGGA